MGVCGPVQSPRVEEAPMCGWHPALRVSGAHPPPTVFFLIIFAIRMHFTKPQVFFRGFPYPGMLAACRSATRGLAPLASLAKPCPAMATILTSVFADSRFQLWAGGKGSHEYWVGRQWVRFSSLLCRLHLSEALLPCYLYTPWTLVCFQGGALCVVLL